VIETVVAWTLLVWADPRFTTGGLVTVQIPGFASRDACMAAAGALSESNARAVASSRERGVGEGERGIDIKLVSCLPVETRRVSG